MPKQIDITQKDNVAQDLLAIIEESRNNEDLLMQKLCVYVSRRDAAVWNAGFQIAKERYASAAK